MKSWVLICFVEKWNFLSLKLLLIGAVVDIVEEGRTPNDTIRLVIGGMVLLLFFFLISIENGLAHLRDMLLYHFATISDYFQRIWLGMSFICIMMIRLTVSLLRSLLPIWAIGLIALIVSLGFAFQVVGSSAILNITFSLVHLMIYLRGPIWGDKLIKPFKKKWYLLSI